MFAMLLICAISGDADLACGTSDENIVRAEAAGQIHEITNFDVEWEFGPHGRIVMMMSSRLKSLAALPDTPEFTQLLCEALTDESRFVAAHAILAVRCFHPCDCVCMKQSSGEFIVIFKGLNVNFTWISANGVFVKNVKYPDSEAQMSKLSELWDQRFSFFRIRQIPLGTPRNPKQSHELPLRNLPDSQAKELKQIEEAFAQAVDAGIIWHEAGMAIYPSLPTQAWQQLSTNPKAVRKYLLKMMEDSSTFVVAHVALTNLVDRNYHHSTHSSGYNVWVNGLTVKTVYDFDAMKWTYTFPRLAEEEHEIRFYWHSKLGSLTTVDDDAVEATRP